jgi:hypothetical protein
MRGLLSMASARSTPRQPIVARRTRAARARGARQVHRLHEGEGAPRVARPVRALGKTVRPAPAARARWRRCRRCAAARGAAAPGRWGRTPRRWMRRRRRCRSSAVGRAPHERMAGARGRPARGEGWAGAARRGRTVGAQVRGQLRARGAAGGGRLAEPQDSVSAAAAALTRPRRCADAGGRVVSARAPDVHDWIHVCVRRCVRSSACACVRTYARMRRMHPSVRVGVGVCVCVLSGGRRATATFIRVS